MFHPQFIISLKFVVLLCCLVFESSAYADLPLTVEGLLTEKGKLKLDMAISYANSERSNASTGDYVSIQTGATSFVTFPTKVGDGVVNSDGLVVTLGLKYGIFANTEIYGRSSWFSSESRNSGVSGISSANNKGLADAWVGVNYKFRDDKKSSAVLGFIETAAIENHNGNSASMASWLIGFTTYRSIDPIVLSLTGGYKFSFKRSEDNSTYQPGNYVVMNPSIGFSANEKITLTTGMQWTNRYSDRVDGASQSIRQTSTDMIFGLGLGVDRNNLLSVVLKSNVSGRSGADLRAAWTHTFE